MPGTFVRMTEPGLKPSSPFQPRGSMALPLAVRGICERRSATLRPVAVFRSALVKASLGNGSRQAASSRRSQPGPVGDAVAACAVDGAARTRARTSARDSGERRDMARHPSALE
jgi:hypothetical protein